MNMRTIITLLSIALMVTFSACAPAGGITPEAEETTEPGQTATPAAVSLMADIQSGQSAQNIASLIPLIEDLVQRINIRPDQVIVVSVEETMWPDGCLGLPEEGELCTMATVPGYKVILDTPEGQFEYHTDISIQRFRLADGEVTTVEPLAPLINDLAKRLGLQPDQITLYSMEEALWPDGCLGLAGEGEMCTMAVVPGFKVILDTPRGQFEYHTNQTLQRFRLATVDPLALLINDLAKRLSIEPAQITLYSMEDVLWPDGCLGAPTKGEMCTMAIVPGYKILLDTPQGQFEYHTDQTLKRFRMAGSGFVFTEIILVDWTRSGGIAGICQHLVIYDNHVYRLSDCRTNRPLGVGMLPEKHIEYMTQQTAALASFEWQNEPIGADQFNDKLSFTGTGTQKASDTEKQAMNDVFAGLAAELVSQSLGDGSSGVMGTVLIGPTCPGPVQLNNPQCADQPYPAKVSVLTAGGQAGAQVQCDANGQFKISLAPGEYTLRFSSPDGSALPHSVEQIVTVSAGQFTEVNITLDSGMR